MPAGDHHAAARLMGAAAGQEDGFQALVPIANTPSSFTAPNRFLKARNRRKRLPLAFEVQHRINHVLQHARAGDAALLGDVADQEHRSAGFLAKRTSRAALSRTWLTEPGAAVSVSVHRVCTESATISRGPALAACCRIDSTPVSASALTPSSGSSRRCAAGDLRQRLFTGDVQHRQFGRHLRHRLQQ